ncbi:MAG: sigma 54-interacting transcriptional regulator, partial [Gammaproteobacteria bacterium]
MGGGERTNERVIAWLGRRPANIEIPVEKLTVKPDEARATLVAFKKAWDVSKDLPQLRRDLASSIAVLVDRASWEASDLSLLNEHEDNLREGGFAEADTVQRVLAAFQTKDQIATAGRIWAAHAAFWLFLILLYPRSPKVQAIFFWNPWVRRLLGLGYVGFLLTWIPPLRAILLAPFKELFLADANLEGFGPKTYFEDSPVRLKTSGQTQAITSAIPEIRGQIVLEGESGLGKTMFLRHLAQRSKRSLLYLPATKCAGGVLEAIQSKLHGYAKDETFLRSLIYGGAIDVCI